MHEAESAVTTAPTLIQYVATIIFVIALLHSFLVAKFNRMAHHHRPGSVAENFFHLMGEVEAVFPLWALVLVIIMAVISSWEEVVHFLETRNFTEPMFVFAIMGVASTKPVIDFADSIIRRIAGLLPFHPAVSFFAATLVVGPLLGSLITEPAAMTLSALLLNRQFFSKGVKGWFLYSTLAVLLVNISVGGSLTNFAAPPVLMVAGTWQWDLVFMLKHFGLKAIIIVLINTAFLAVVFRGTLSRLNLKDDSDRHGRGEAKIQSVPAWVKAIHLLAIAGLVINSHHPAVFMGVFFVFLGFYNISQEYQEPLKLKSSLLVAGFLGGLILIGGFQEWWISPILRSLGDIPLYIGATGLTAITDNALLTYLVSQVQGLADSAKYLAVAGALAGGGLTLIANAPNPIAKSILGHAFGQDGINPIKLLAAALFPTAVAFLVFLLVPSLP